MGVLLVPRIALHRQVACVVVAAALTVSIGIDKSHSLTWMYEPSGAFMKATTRQLQRGDGQEDERGRPVRVPKRVQLPFLDSLFSVISTCPTHSLCPTSVSSAPFIFYHSYGLQRFDS